MMAWRVDLKEAARRIVEYHLTELAAAMADVEVRGGGAQSASSASPANARESTARPLAPPLSLPPSQGVAGAPAGRPRGEVWQFEDDSEVPRRALDLWNPLGVGPVHVRVPVFGGAADRRQ